MKVLSPARCTCRSIDGLSFRAHRRYRSQNWLYRYPSGCVSMYSCQRGCRVPDDACTDRDDIKFLECAVGCRADCVVSGDRALLRARRRNASHPLTARGDLQAQRKSARLRHLESLCRGWRDLMEDKLRATPRRAGEDASLPHAAQSQRSNWRATGFHPSTALPPDRATCPLELTASCSFQE